MYITLTLNGKPIAINMDHIIRVAPGAAGGCHLTQAQGGTGTTFDQSYEEVIGALQVEVLEPHEPKPAGPPPRQRQIVAKYTMR